MSLLLRKIFGFIEWKQFRFLIKQTNPPTQLQIQLYSDTAPLEIKLRHINTQYTRSP